jgi:class 3 adenylate cyclase/CHASE2 domain-containing sensor protein
MIKGRLSYNFRSCALGVGLTIGVIALSFAGALAAFENWLYDQRARHFQRFTPPPTNRLVHVDIDDAALETVGRWPWPRGTQADLIKEIRQAGADFLAIDIVLSDEDRDPRVKSDAGTPDDQRLVEAIERFGRVLVPVSFSYPRREGDQLVTAARGDVVTIMAKDLELDDKAVAAKLPAGAVAPGNDAYLVARRAALQQRIRDALSRERVPAEILRKQLLPRTTSSPGWETSSLSHQFNQEYLIASAAVELRRFSRAKPADCPPLRIGTRPRISPRFARAAKYTGFVDDVPSTDGTVRGLPLWVQSDDGVLYPLFDLTVACAVMNVDVRDVQVERERVIIPRSDGSRIEIPTRTVDFTEDEAPVGTYFNIPWFGGRDWQTMYDFPRNREVRQHVPAALLWGLSQSRKTVAANNAAAMKEMQRFAGEGLPEAGKFLASPPPPEDVAAWAVRVGPVVTEAAAIVAPVEQTPAENLTDVERDYLTSYRAIRAAAEESKRFVEKAAEVRSVLNGKVVLLGSAASSALDQRPTSLHAMCPGVVIHGAALSALLQQEFWRFAPPWVSTLITAALGLIVTAIVTFFPPWKALAATTAALVAYGAFNAVLLFDYANIVVGLGDPFAVIAIVWGMLTLMRFVVERGERARITRKFRGYVDPQLVEYVVQHPELARFEGQVREMTVCFTDLAGFTSMTEKLRENAVPILGRYINRMVKIMRKHRGFLNRLMGDGIMFSYGAPLENPNHAVDAVNTVLEMQEEMEKLNAELAVEGLPQLSVRGGVSTGNVVVGDSGGTEAVDYTALGDTTNFGARLESANKYTGTKNLISARTVELLNGQFLLRPVALLQVAGKTKSVMVYEPLARTEDATDEQRKLAAMCRGIFEHYQAGRFENCIAAIDEMEQAFGPSKLGKLYRDACDKYIVERAPDGFCGQIVLSEK